MKAKLTIHKSIAGSYFVRNDNNYYILKAGFPTEEEVRAFIEQTKDNNTCDYDKEPTNPLNAASSPSQTDGD